MTNIQVLRGDGGTVTWAELKLTQDDVTQVFEILTRHLAPHRVGVLHDVIHAESGPGNPMAVFSELLKQTVRLQQQEIDPPMQLAAN